MSTNYKFEKAVEPAKDEKPGFFQRVFQKLDDKMKEKADASESCCCGCDESKSEKDSDKCC